jgi:sulfur carrier protein
VNVQVNGAPLALPDDATIASVLAHLELGADARGIAVAVDAEVVPRGRWAAASLHDGASVEIVQAVQGG